MLTNAEKGSLTSFTSKELVTDQDIRWCPGCGDYSVLKQVQTVMPSLGIPREKIVFVSGIGCSSRFPYYMETYGVHSIHGRATAVASGLKIARPDLSVWIVTGDGDALSIGGNHTIHLLRRNLNVQVLLFNNEIYGLTKGQYSPTSPEGQISKSTPTGSLDHPFNPLALALGADGTFVARSLDRDPKHLQAMTRRAAEHRGTSLLEIYQNCNVFNDGAFEIFTEKGTKAQTTIFVEQGQPLVFGTERELGIRLDGYRPQVVNLREGQYSLDDLWMHDEKDLWKAQTLARFFSPLEDGAMLPRPFGVLYAVDRPCYEDRLHAQLADAAQSSPPDLDALIRGREIWEVVG